ncbi:MAG: toxin-antitoxin system, antitoxin component, Xre family protein, partial [Leptolyngbyaceae bacterium]|nr:toxin-antitoxin system, antitoxin component, Xre family protein [Leptolyngbyaceae bacterium]
MQALSDREKQILAKIRQCSLTQPVEIEDFIDFLSQRHYDKQIVATASAASEPFFAQVWHNPKDA